MSYWKVISERSVEGQASRSDARYLFDSSCDVWIKTENSDADTIRQIHDMTVGE